MNTLLLLPGLFSSEGGIERTMRLYVRAIGEIAGTGTVHAVVLNDPTLDLERLAPYATRALAPPIVCGRRKLACAWHTLRLARRCQRLICGHVHLLPLAHFARRFSPHLEVWLIAHGIEVWRPFGAAERRALQAADRILCVSAYTRGQLLTHCPHLSGQRLLVQPNALDPLFEPERTAPQAVEPGLLLAVSRLVAAEAYKGIDHLVTALPAIRCAVPGARLRVVGDGDDRGRLIALAHAHGVGAVVEFCGRVSDSELQRHLAACQVFALPSRAEGFGLVYLEALAHGKPCLAAAAGGAPEVVNSSCGALVPYGDVPALAQAAIALLRRNWDPRPLQARAAEFSYANFRRQLTAICSPSAATMPP